MSTVERVLVTGGCGFIGAKPRAAHPRLGRVAGAGGGRPADRARVVRAERPGGGRDRRRGRPGSPRARTRRSGRGRPPGESDGSPPVGRGSGARLRRQHADHVPGARRLPPPRHRTRGVRVVGRVGRRRHAADPREHRAAAAVAVRRREAGGRGVRAGIRGLVRHGDDGAPVLERLRPVFAPQGQRDPELHQALSQGRAARGLRRRLADTRLHPRPRPVRGNHRGGHDRWHRRRDLPARHLGRDIGGGARGADPGGDRTPGPRSTSRSAGRERSTRAAWTSRRRSACSTSSRRSGCARGSRRRPSGTGKLWSRPASGRAAPSCRCCEPTRSSPACSWQGSRSAWSRSSHTGRRSSTSTRRATSTRCATSAGSAAAGRLPGVPETAPHRLGARGRAGGPAPVRAGHRGAPLRAPRAAGRAQDVERARHSSRCCSTATS